MNESGLPDKMDGLPSLDGHLHNISYGGIVSLELRTLFTVLNFAILCGFLFIFGSATNMINIIVFLKIGFKDPVNISLLVLAISDFGCCFSLFFLSFCYNPFVERLDLPFDPADFHYLTSGWIHNTFTRITSCITAFITFERCLCVAAPLKVRDIITPKRVIIILSCIVVFVVACVSPIFYTARYKLEFSPARNKSIIVLYFIENSEEVDNVAFAIHSIFLPIAAFFVVLVSTLVLVLNLRQKSKWRENAAKASSSLNRRDAKVSQMVVVIAILFIVCFIPIFISFTTMLAVPEFNIKGQYKNVFLIMFSFHFALESTNSSLNIFIYYRMSSNYRRILFQLCGRNVKTETEKDQLALTQR